MKFRKLELSSAVDNETVTSELTIMLFKNAVRSNLVVLAAVVIIYYIFWAKLPVSFLLGWCCCMLLPVFYRFYLIFKFTTRTTSAAEIRVFYSKYISATFVVSFCWMVIIAFGLSMPEFEDRIFFVLLLVSLLGASVPALAASLTAIYIYVLIPAAAAIPLLLLLGGKEAAIGIALFIYTLMIIKAGQNIYNTLRSSIQLRIHLQGLKDNLEIKVAERTEELRISRDAAEQANRTKSAFLANMSHEIRTPMNAIINLSHLALQEEIPEKAAGFIKRVNRSGVGLLGIINDILDFSKIESGKLNIERIPFELQTIMTEIESEFGYRAKEKGLDFIHHLEGELNGSYLGDPLRVRQILTNIIGNAIKFTEKGGVTLTVREIAEPTDKRMLEFIVTDTGIGISEEQQKNLFKPFQQADDSTTRKYGGSGLGLVISMQLAELMDGSISLTSTPEKGSTFGIRLPLAIAESTMNTNTRDSKTPDILVEQLAKLEGKTVLIVDDIEANQIILSSILENIHINTRLAKHGKEALQLLKHQHFDLIFMDIQMPVMDGYQTTRTIRERAKWSTLPIIAITANVFPEDIQKCYEAGMDFYLAKPFKPDSVHKTLVQWIASS